MLDDNAGDGQPSLSPEERHAAHERLRAQFPNEGPIWVERRQAEDAEYRAGLERAKFWEESERIVQDFLACRPRHQKRRHVLQFVPEDEALVYEHEDKAKALAERMSVDSNIAKRLSLSNPELSSLREVFRNLGWDEPGFERLHRLFVANLQPFDLRHPLPKNWAKRVKGFAEFMNQEREEIAEAFAVGQHVNEALEMHSYFMLDQTVFDSLKGIRDATAALIKNVRDTMTPFVYDTVAQPHINARAAQSLQAAFEKTIGRVDLSAPRPDDWQEVVDEFANHVIQQRQWISPAFRSGKHTELAKQVHECFVQDIAVFKRLMYNDAMIAIVENVRDSMGLEAYDREYKPVWFDRSSESIAARGALEQFNGFNGTQGTPRGPSPNR